MTSAFAAPSDARSGIFGRSSILAHYLRSTAAMARAFRLRHLAAFLALALWLPLTTGCQTLSLGQKEEPAKTEAPAEEPGEEIAEEASADVGVTAA